MNSSVFYDINPFNYGYSSKQEVINNMNPILKSLIKKNSGKIICDVGCGCGRNLIYALNYARRLIGVDLSKESLSYARKFVNDDSVELIHGDNLNIPIKSNIVDMVISDGVCHHTGDTISAFNECVRILKPGGILYLAVYKKYRYYPFVYYLIGGYFRFIYNFKLGKFILEHIFVNFHFILYKIFKKQILSRIETRNIFFDYFMTPIATFQSKSDVNMWCFDRQCKIIDYDKTSGNCHIFIIKKDE